MTYSLVELKKTLFTSNGARNSTRFFNYFCIQKKLKNLVLKKHSNAGRGNNGKIVCWSKTSLKRKIQIPHINLNLRYNKLSFIGSFQFVPLKNKLLALIFVNNGSYMYLNTTENFILFDYFYWNRTALLLKYHSKLLWSLLFLIKKLSAVNFLELMPEKGAQYIKSSGTKGKLFYLDQKLFSCLIILPSKTRKIFSFFSTALLGQNSLSEKKFFLNGKSGYWRSFGFKPTVRGVAMNPVDHPHGGRTKAIRHQRTPWGKTTKLK